MADVPCNVLNTTEGVYLIIMSRSFIFLLLLSINLHAGFREDSTIFISELGNYESSVNRESGIPISGPWKFMKGDNVAWADARLDDSGWMYINPNLDTLTKNPGLFGGIGWFRVRVNVDQQYAGVPLAFMITQSGASDIYVDGKFVHSFGVIDTKKPGKEERYDPQFVPIDIVFDTAGVHTIAIRYANARAEDDVISEVNTAPGFDLKIGLLADNIESKYINSNIVTAIFVFYFTFFLALSLLHFVIWLYYRVNRSNLYYSIFAGSFGFIFLTIMSAQNLTDPDLEIVAARTNEFLSCVYAPALIAMMYTIFYGRLIKIFWLWLAIYVVEFALFVFHAQTQLFTLGTFLIFCVESLRVIVAAIYKKREGAWIIGSGVLVTITFLMGFVILALIGKAQFIYEQGGVGAAVFGVVFIYMTLSIPIHMSVYLARDFARTNKKLELKLVEVKELSEQTVRQEKERQRILEEQKDLLEFQVEERTAEIVEQKKVIEEKNKDITDSIHYAKKIQEAMLPANDVVAGMFASHFVLYKPKDIVSGDFYWVAEHNGKRFIAAVDCTGHGVPGALMSMTGNNFLNQIVIERNISSPKEILIQLNTEVRKSLRQDDVDTESKDGMDIALCSFSADLKTLTYAGANRPLWLVREGQLEEFRPVKQSIGGMATSFQFEEKTVALQPGDCIYIFSDGYADQFGGPEGKKFMSRKLKDLVISVSKLVPQEQRAKLESAITNWKGSLTQVDDILVIGIRV